MPGSPFIPVSVTTLASYDSVRHIGPVRDIVRLFLTAGKVPLIRNPTSTVFVLMSEFHCDSRCCIEIARCGGKSSTGLKWNWSEKISPDIVKRIF